MRFVESAVTSRIICTVRRWATLKEGRKGGREGGREGGRQDARTDGNAREAHLSDRRIDDALVPVLLVQTLGHLVKGTRGG